MTSVARSEKRNVVRSHLKHSAVRVVWKTIPIVVPLVAIVLMWHLLRAVSLSELWQLASSFPRQRLVGALGFSIASYFCLTFFDYLALRYVRAEIPYYKAALASFCALSIGHNLGFAALSSGAVRTRFYMMWGLQLADVAKLIVFCGVTVALGLSSLGGLYLLISPDIASDLTGFTATSLRLLGAILTGSCLIYVTLCYLQPRARQVAGIEFQLPSGNIGLAQIFVSTLNFTCVAGCLHQAMSATTDLSFATTVTIYVSANVAALLTHVPGGLGVIEGVVISLVPDAKVIVSVLAFRLTYFIVPLAIGGSLFITFETLQRFGWFRGGLAREELS